MVIFDFTYQLPATVRALRGLPNIPAPPISVGSDGMPEPKKKTPDTDHLDESRTLLAEMDAILKRVRALLLERPALVPKTVKDGDKT